MPEAAIWLKYYRRRYQWAVGAYDRFVQDLAPELVSTLPRSEQVTVAVYGATQVGKTTLILELLGLSTLTSDEVCNVLRGGQQLGKSATAMPVRYGRSQDDSWYIAGAGPLSADVAREMLGAFRQQVESGSIRDTEILDIRIPQRLFPQQTDSWAGPALNIIDIPGINSRSAVERDLVVQLAHRYVTVADLVLLVGRADSLGFLNEENLQIGALAEWAAQPARFRIVLTFSYSPISLYRQFIGQGLTLDRVRDVLIAEMSSHDYDFPGEFRRNLFMLELGDSIAALERTNREYCQRIVEITRGFREALLGDIERASGPYARLNGAFQLDRVINARMERLRQMHKKQNDDFDERRQQFIHELAAFYPDLRHAQDAAISDAIEKVKDAQVGLREKLSELSDSMKMLADFNYAGLFSTELRDSVKETVPWLREQLELCEGAQRAACSQVARRLVEMELLPEWFEDDVPTLSYQRNCLMDIESHLDAYVFDDYWISSNFNEDRDRLLKALRRVADDHGERLRSATSRALQERMRSLKVDCDELHKQRIVLQFHLERLKALASERSISYVKYVSDLQEMEGSLGMASRFESQLNAAFLSELRKTRDEVTSHPIPAQRFYSLLHTRLLLSEIDRMYEGKSF